MMHKGNRDINHQGVKVLIERTGSLPVYKPKADFILSCKNWVFFVMSA